MALFLTKLARLDLKSIAKYTEKEHGKDQRNKYLKKIDKIFSLIVENPNLGTSCFHIRDGYYKYPIGKHIIFYRKITESNIEVVRVLHNRVYIETKF
jgi:toxin ParE1/3/4